MQLLVLMMALIGSCEALCWEASLDLVGGYRRDTISTSLNSSESTNFLQLRTMQTYDTGLCGWASLERWFVRGEVNWGTTVRHGEYKVLNYTSNGTFQAEVSGGNTQDDTIGAGYLFRWGWLDIGPAVGWSYNQLRTSLDDLTMNGEPFPSNGKLSYTNRWTSPWVGFELRFMYVCVDIDAGYEYHFPRWRGTLKDASDSSNRKANNGYGSVVFIRGYYPILCHFNLGLELKYQDWRTWNGHANATNDLLALTIPRNTWRSLEVQLSIGHDF